MTKPPPTRLLIALLTLWVAACSTLPESLPTRRGIGGEAQPVAGTQTPQVEEPSPGVDETTEEDPLFAPVRDAIAAGDWMAAQQALPRDRATAASPGDPWWRYYGARIALLRGDLATHDDILAELAARPSPPTLHRELLLHRLQRAERAGDALASADLAHALLLAGGHPASSREACEARLWAAVQGLPADSPSLHDRAWRSWHDLARAADRARGDEAAAAIDRWLARHPEHAAAARARTLRDAALADSGRRRVALLLPLSGPLADAGDAVGNGFFAAFWDQPDAALQIDVLDSRRFDNMQEAWTSAVERGAGAVIGPLGKRQVSALLATHPVEPPLLALNRPDPPMAAAPWNLQLSLAAEDEAIQIARRAYASGARRALLLRPEGEWGERMEAALSGAWHELGAEIRSRGLFNRPDRYASVVSEALNFAASEARGRELRRLLGEPLKTAGRRREDVDVVFLLSKSADEARALKPLLDYHFAGDLPVYALSTADDGRDANANRDLNGLQLPVMPWRLGTPTAGLDAADAADAFAALHALGVDAFALSQRLYRLGSGAGLRYRGSTAILGADAAGILWRDLPMAAFDRGALQPR
jgi:outer membrane PBP1 activator LpoA protein